MPGGAGFIRRFTSLPTFAELTAIEGVVVVDRDVPEPVTGIGTGTTLVVGEFENGPFNTPTEVLGGADLANQFGGFGYTYEGVVASNPCARVRNADGAVQDEYWNGNGFIALANKTFTRLIAVRVDTSVGSVEFSRLASLLGGSQFSYDLATGQTLVFSIDGGAPVTATFTGVPATTNSAAGTYPSTFVGGETISYVIDDVAYTTTFYAADQAQNQVIARLNATVGYAAFANGGGGVTSITGRIGGTDGNVQITAVSAALVTTATGFTPGAAVAGTGNVGNIDQVTVAEANTIVSAATTADVLVDRDAAGFIRVRNVATPLTGTLEITGASTATGFGFTSGVEADAAVGDDGTIPAGTRVRNVGGTEWVTMQDVAVTEDDAGPYSVKVRPAVDDGTTGSAAPATVTTVPSAIALGAFSVTNPLTLTAALSEAAIDAAYVEAIAVTNDVTTVAQETNLMFSARQSNAVRSALRQNASEASDEGCFGRVCFICPPLKTTTRAMARSDSAQPGVGAYRSQRVVYAFPGARTFIPQIATRGLAGGDGFTADGLVDVHYDSWEASTCSQLPPEENPGQLTTFQQGIVSIEAGNPDVQNMSIADYRAFKAAGIAALRINGGSVFIQSGILSVDPALNPAQKNISRRRMADYIEDSLSTPLNSVVKQLATDVRRAQIVSICDGFLSGLRSKDNPANQRIADYSVDGRSGNTPTLLAQGVFVVVLKVRLLPSLDVIVLDVTAGETVEVALRQAA